MKTKTLLRIAVVAWCPWVRPWYGLYAIGMQRGIGMATGPDRNVRGWRCTSCVATEAACLKAPPRAKRQRAGHITAGIQAGDVDPMTGKKVLYYHDPMVPGNKFDKPAKSPFMDMMLVPVYATATATAAR